ncbi:MAG: response regulator [Bacteroidia bacterium]|nr:response regulator [Bacteroidia bacterium]
MNYARIFLLDDNDTTNFYNTDVLSDYDNHVQITAFTNPEEFITFFITNKDVQTEKSLLLLDINMPEKKGFDVVEELEENAESMDELDIIMVSSSNLKIDFEKSTRFPNIIGYIEKPLTAEKLNKVLSGEF